MFSRYVCEGTYMCVCVCPCEYSRWVVADPRPWVPDRPVGLGLSTGGIRGPPMRFLLFDDRLL